MALGLYTTFTLDMVPGGAPPIIHVSAEDVGRKYTVNLTYNGEPYDIQGNRLTIEGTKPDGTVFEYPVDDFEQNENWVEFLIKNQMAIVPGTVRCKLREYLNDDKIGSATFILDVDEYVYDPEAASESYIPSYETAIQEALENVADDIADLATAAAINDVKQYSDAASASATAAAGSATSAQTSAGTATTAAGSATSAAEDAEDSADRAEAAAESMAAYNTDRTPYLLRQSGGGVETGDREYDAIVGGTVAFNQLGRYGGRRGEKPCFGTIDSSVVSETTTSMTLNSSNTTYWNNIPSGHKILLSADMSQLADSTSNMQVNFGGDIKGTGVKLGTTVKHIAVIGQMNGASYTDIYFYPNGVSGGFVANWTIANLQIFDLTQMFGSTIADYIYSLEQATAGAGVAWFRQFFPEDYYPYNAGELLSVSGVSAHVMRDADENIIGNYPLDDSLTLRGIPKLDGGKLYYDGDTYESDGTVTRKYGVRAYQSGDESLADAITDGTNTVYKLTTPTTETADPFTNPQVVDQNGTEEYVTDSIVPVGHDTRYRVNLADKLEPIFDVPTTDGTYTLTVTVSNGVATYSWSSS